MPRPVHIVMLVVVGLLIGCSGEGGKSGDGAGAGKSESNDFAGTPGVQRIPDPAPPEVPNELLKIRPAFDEAGVGRELAVGPREIFTIYIIGEHPDPYYVTGAAFRMEIPAGVEVMGSQFFTEGVMSIGSYKESLQMAFACREPESQWLVKFICRTVDGFTGGEVRTDESINHTGVNFIGFSSCSPDPQRQHEESEMLLSVGGTSTLRMK